MRIKRPAGILALPASLLPWLAACQGEQSMLDPQSPGARGVADLWWFMFWGAVAIMVLVIVLTLYATFRSPARRRPIHATRFIVLGGIAFPVVVLSALLGYTIAIGNSLIAQSDDALRIEVVGKQWWWEVRYPEQDGRSGFVTANEIRLPAGRPVEIAVVSDDVIHSFWVPALAGKVDMIPGRVNHVSFTADTPGTYRGQCAEFCGAQHARMAIFVVVESEADYTAWARVQGEPAEAPRTPMRARGQQAFVDYGCVACHTVRGHAPGGEVGPDLTHVGSRLSLAAGTLPNNQGTLAGWIGASQELKPGNLMPSFRELDGETLRAVAAYLEGLE